MNDAQALLNEIHQARLDRLKEICAQHGLSRNGSVEFLRARLIADLILDEWDLSPEGIQKVLNNELGGILAVFGIKKSGSIRERRQRLYLHLNHDAKQLVPEKLENLSREKLHDLCVKLDLPRSGTKQVLTMRVAGVLMSQLGSWGQIKKSLRRPRGKVKQIPIPSPLDSEFEELVEDSSDGDWKTIEEMQEELTEEVVKETLRGMIDNGTFTDDEKEILEEAYSQMNTDELVIKNTDTFIMSPEALMSKLMSGETLTTEELKQLQNLPETPNEDVEVIEINQAPIMEVEEEIEITENLLSIEKRQAEVDALCRDFLLVGTVNDSEDVAAFIESLSKQGLPVDDKSSIAFVRDRLIHLDNLSKQEKEAMHSLPGSWREKEALRSFEEARTILRDSLPSIILENPGDQVKARMAFEERARNLGLDLRMPSISGRLHALFDLQISLDDEIASSDPRTARRTRVARLLQHGAVHLNHSERRTLDRLERNMGGFEHLCEAIFEKSEGTYNESQQALVIRFLEKKGYEVNTPEIRPRVIAAAGVIGAELGFISPSEIPRIAPGIKVSDTEIDSIVTDLKRLAKQFKKDDGKEESLDLDEEVAESVSDAADRVISAKTKLNSVDELLARLSLQNN